MNINLEYYKIFYYVGKMGGITLAAEALSISQPAVSQAIKNLEKAVGMPLFVRTRKGVRLTAAGEILFSYVERGYSTILLGEKKIRDMMNLECGEIRIGASDMTLQFFLLPFLQRFHESYPKVKITVTNGPTPETMKYLQEGKIDFGVVTGPLRNLMDMYAYPVREIRDIFVAGEKFLEYKNKEIPCEQLENLPIICLEKNTSTRSYIDEFLMNHGTKLNPEIELATSDMLVQFARRNLGVACVVEDFAKPYLESEELFPFVLEKEIPHRYMYVICAKKNPLSAAADRLIQTMNMKG